MFFYTRYPSSTILRNFFPDVKFSKNLTAQLVKWFSNFREFFYIQMEKYARQFLAEGVKSCDEIHVDFDSEIFRVLNSHYNRNNQLEVCYNNKQIISNLILYLLNFLIFLLDTGELLFCNTSDTSRVLQSDPRVQRPRSVVEESHLQDYCPHGRYYTGFLQVHAVDGVFREQSLKF